MSFFVSSAYAQDHGSGHDAAGHGAVTPETALAGELAVVEHDGAPFPPFDPTYFESQIFWLAVTFGFFFWYLTTKILPRLNSIVEVREDRITADLDEAERLRAESAAAVAAYEQALAEAKAKAGAIAVESRDAAAKALDSRKKAAEADLAARLSAAETEISGIKTTAMAEVDAIATETAEAIVSALIGQGTRDEAAAAVATVRNG